MRFGKVRSRRNPKAPAIPHPQYTPRRQVVSNPGLRSGWATDTVHRMQHKYEVRFAKSDPETPATMEE